MIGLTDKERRTMDLLIEGRRDREIAEILGVSHRTVAHTVTRVCNKLGALTRAQAAAMFASGSIGG